ncbi:lysophospholipid acyltransferase family protein [Actinorhabdospora filicis]|uniref:lysophospholipid acyltransferase family protein n=1 Tax=Actinorhabdospora filicis TaxID=1785913 RepID=UPI0025533DDA|nr:1-acyl-sn-glycerol-3-phosphate acyltransferase [Actinorhabdospora filicis]
MPARRIWRDPAAFGFALTGTLALLPLIVLLGLVLPVLPRRTRPGLRLLVVSWAWLATYEAGCLATGFTLWLRRRPRTAWAAAQRWWLAAWIRLLCPLGRIRLSVSGTGWPDGTRPILVLSQHIGSFNGPLVLHLLHRMLDQDTVPIVKTAIGFDPAMDLMLRRLDAPFIRTDAGGRVPALRAIDRLCRSGAPVLLFPEGTSYTRARARAIADRLRGGGNDAEADRAERLRRSLWPHTGGVQIALRSQPDVVFLAHSGLAPVLPPAAGGSVAADGVVRARYWVVPAESVPQGREEQARWLHGWWERIDRWSELAHA